MRVNLVLLRKCPAQRLQGFAETQMLQDGAMQLARNVSHSQSQLFRFASQLCKFSMGYRQLVSRQAFQMVEADGEHGNLLSNVIVELARDTAAFFFLSANQPARQVANAFVVLVEFLLIFQKTRFRLLPLFKENSDKHDGQRQDGKEQLQKMHVVCHCVKKRALMLRDAEYQEHCCEKEPAGTADGTEPERSPHQEGKWSI